MRFLIILIFTNFAINSIGQSREIQLIGTHVFVEVPPSFIYSFDPSGYADSLNGIFISAMRAPESIKIVKPQFSNQTQFEIAKIFKTRHLVVKTEISKGGEHFTNFMIPIGDENESAVVTILATNFEENIVIIETLINSIKWKEKSDLNFEKAYFFELEGLDDFKVMSKINNNFMFVPKDISFPDPGFTLSIGTNIMLVDYAGNEREIVEYLVNPNNEPLYTLSKEFHDQIIDNLNSITIKWVYKQNKNTVKRYFTTIFTDGRFYFIDAKSISPEFDYLLTEYDTMISTFKLKMNIE